MRNSKFILLISISLFFITPCYAQKARVLSRLFGRNPDAVSNTVTKGVGKEAVNKTTKEIAEELAEESIKKNVWKSAVDKTIKKESVHLTEKQVKTLLERKAAASWQEIISRQAPIVLMGTPVIIAGKEMTKETFQKMSVDEVVRFSKKELTDRMVKYSGGRADGLYAREMAKLSSGILMDDLIKILGERAAKIWKEICGENFEKYTKILLSDISNNRHLMKALKKNPLLLKAYRQIINSVYRTDLTILRYINYGAGKFSRMMSKHAKKWGFGEDIMIKTEGGVSSIYNAAGEFLGTIKGNAKSGYIIECSTKNRTLLNLYPMSNATYQCQGNIWKTDQYGRVIYAKATISSPPAGTVARNSQLQKDATTMKNGYNVDGTQTGKTIDDDEGGHIIALQHGGTNDMINFFPQSKRTNRNEGAFDTNSQAWYRSEGSATRAVKQGRTVEREVRLNYKDKRSMRPATIGLTQKVDGQYEVLRGNKYGPAVTLNNLIINNN